MHSESGPEPAPGLAAGEDGQAGTQQGAVGRPVQGLAVVLAAGFLLAAILVGARLWPPSFIGLLIAAMALAGYATHRWPRATLVLAVLLTFADPVLIRVALPAEVRLDPLGASEPLLAVACLVIAIRVARQRALVPALRDPVLAFAALFVAVAGLSAALNAVPIAVAVLGIVMTMDAVVLYFVARMTRFGDRSAARTVAAVVAVATAVATFGILQAVLHPDLLGFASFAGRFGEGGRIVSFVGNPNMVAMLAGMALPFPIFATARRSTDRRSRWLAGAAAYLLLLALVLTFSRGTWLAVVIGIAVGTLVLDRRAFVTFALLTVVAAATTYVMPRYVLLTPDERARYLPEDRAPSLIDSTIDRIGVVGRQRDLRVRYVREALPIIMDQPALGVGPGRYGGAAAAITGSPVYEEYGIGLYGFRTVHNFWLHLIGEVGVIGLAIFMAMVVSLGIRLARGAHAVRAGPASTSRFVVLAGAATMLLVVSLNGLTEMTFEGNTPAMLVWLVVGVASLLVAPQGLLGERRATGRGW